jgi:hypothetical protein
MCAERSAAYAVAVARRTPVRPVASVDEAALELRPELGRDVTPGQRAEAGGDAVVRTGVPHERVDDAAGALDLGERLVGERDAGPVPRDGDDVVDRGGADADRDQQLRVHAPHSTERARLCHPRRGKTCL